MYMGVHAKPTGGTPQTCVKLAFSPVYSLDRVAWAIESTWAEGKISVHEVRRPGQGGGFIFIFLFFMSRNYSHNQWFPK